jgi:diacylglycerol kinase (ATP)
MRQSLAVARFERILFVVNPAAGAGGATAKAAILRRELTVRGYSEPQVIETSPERDPELRRAIASSDLVVAFGGDGTLNRVITKAVLAGADVSPVIAFLPSGTGNAAARAFNLPRSPQRLATYIVSVRPREIDVGIVTRDGQDFGAFLLWAGAGVDAAMITEVARRRPTKQGLVLMSQYLRVAAGMFLKNRFPPIKVHVRSGQPPCTAASVMVANVGALAIGSVTRKADPCDGILDVIGTASRSRAAWIAAAMLSAAEQYDRCSDVVRQRVTEVELTTDENVPLHLDGEPAGALPVQIRVAPRRIRLLARE